MRAAVTFFDGVAVGEGTLVGDAAGVRLLREPAPDDASRVDGIVTGLFTDHHVHLQLVDPTPLATSRLGRVVDLGGNPEVLRDRRHPSGGSSQLGASGAPQAIGADAPAEGDAIQAVREHVEVDYAGPFLTAVGGYPSDREWAPAGAVRQVRDAVDAAALIDSLAATGVSCIKVVGNSDAGPVLGDDLFRAVVGAAAKHGLSVVAHAEGVGQAQRVARLGAARLAHSPFTERLSDDEIEQQAESVSWISTMAIHEGDAYANVVDNVRRFSALGGELVYGSDMGNGPTLVDLRDSELAALREAGVEGTALLRTLAPLDPFRTGAVLLLLPDGDPARARRLTFEDLEE